LKQSSGPKRLIVTADDFGAAVAVNAAVEVAHRDGMLTAASLMVAGEAAADAVARARAMPTLGVGLHVVLVEGRPVLPPERIPALTGPDGLFRTDMVRMAVRIFFDPAARAQLRAEVAAQFEAFAATGLPLDHVNAHKHFHLHPVIAQTIIAVGRDHGMTAVRAPVEPIGRPGVAGLWARHLQKNLRRQGFAVPDQVFGLAWSGAMDTGRMRGLSESLPDGLTEIYTHPATGPYPGSAPGYLYADELAALTDPVARAALLRHEVTLGRFADFAEQR